MNGWVEGLLIGLAICAGLIIWAELRRRWYRHNSVRVSVLLIVRNQENCIEGWLREMLEDLEAEDELIEDLVIVDECSSDDTPEILVALGKQYPFAQMVTGMNVEGEALNVGMRYCTGPIVCVFDTIRHPVLLENRADGAVFRRTFGPC